MRAFELLESRGVSARAPGETYVSDTDPSDILTIQDITVLPTEGDSYEDMDQMMQAVDSAIPDTNTRIDDNKPNSGTKAVILATVSDKDGKGQTHVRYIRAIPPQGVHTMWKTLNGYKFSKGAEQESVPIKPSDLVPDENYRSATELAQQIKAGSNDLGELGEVMEMAVDQALAGTNQPIPGGDKYYNVLQKYGGEYLGPIALMTKPNSVTGDTSKMLQAFELSNLAGSKVMFPQDTAMELIDSVIQTANGRSIQISSKISTSGGAASSLSGVYKQMTPEIEQRFTEGSNIIKLLATESSVNGPLKVARMFNIIDDNDVQAMANLDKRTQNIGDLQSERLQQMTQQQGVANGTQERPDYRVFWHALTAVMNAVIPVVNANEDFKNAMLEVLNNNEYVQLVTKAVKQGDAVSMQYYTKFPAVFKGAPQLVNKTYFATGQKGRIGFKLK
tara:strand:- start:169 stop:1509 length:1341 start_codon:yes stop_codon:yes gene_type:complete